MAIDPSLMPTPPMGFNTWNRFGMHIDERLVLETIEALDQSGLKAAGYRYVNIDDGWMAPERDARGRLAPDPERFGGGIRRLADAAHAAGFKLGIYSDCGTKTCGGLPASYGHERVDAETFAEWGVDYLKHDWCNVPLEEFPGKTEGEVAEILYTRMSEALVATGRPIVLSMCNWGHGWPWEWARGLAHLWRTTPDITDLYRGTWKYSLGMVDIYHRNVPLADFAGPGGFNDPDMLEVGNGKMTDTEYRSHFALWCLMAAPLLIGCDVRAMDEATRAILTNERLIRVDQDPLGRQGRLVEARQGVSILRKPLADGSVAVGVFNERDQEGTAVCRWNDLLGAGDGAVVATDLWTGADTTVSGTGQVTVPPHATLVYQLRRAGA